MFVVAIRTQAPPGVRDGAGHVFAEDGVGEGSGTRRGDDATTDGETRADERGARKRTLDDAGGTRRASRGATRGGHDGDNDGGDDTRGDDEEQSGQNMDKDAMSEAAAASAAQTAQGGPPTAGPSIWGGARARTEHAIGGAVNAIGGMLRMASSWWRKRQRDSEDDGPDRMRKRPKGDG